MDVLTLESRIYAARFLSSLPKDVLLAGLEKTTSQLGIDKIQFAMDIIGMSSDTKQFFVDARAKEKSLDQLQSNGLDGGMAFYQSTNSIKRRP